MRFASSRGCGWNRSPSRRTRERLTTTVGRGAWIGEFELGCTVGTGRTPDEAIEDLLDLLPDLNNGELPLGHR